MTEKIGKCHDCTAPQTEVNILSRHILELQADKGRLTDKVRDLEAEVKEWKDKADLWCKTANLKDHNIMINKELEKENAELKHTIATLRQEKDNVSMHAKAMEVVTKTRSDQLTKAKELLRYYFDCFKNDNKYTLSDFEVVEDTEQFLKNNA